MDILSQLLSLVGHGQQPQAQQAASPAQKVTDLQQLLSINSPVKPVSPNGPVQHVIPSKQSTVLNGIKFGNDPAANFGKMGADPNIYANTPDQTIAPQDILGRVNGHVIYSPVMRMSGAQTLPVNHA